MEKQIIFLDVDGTLVTYENTLPDSAVKAIKKAQNNGHKVYTVTGRSKAEMYEEILAIGFDGYIGGNGSYIESNDEVIAEKTLTLEDCKEIIDWLHINNLEFYLESNSGLFGSSGFEIAAEDAIQIYAARKGKDGSDNITTKHVFPDMIYGKNLKRSDVNKISFLLNSYDDYLRAKEYFKKYQVGNWGGAGETALFGDIALNNIDKRTAITQLLDFLGKSEKNTIAFGDAAVDIPMLEVCGTGIAMGNGSREIKEIADHVTDDVANDGLYNAFRHLKLI